MSSRASKLLYFLLVSIAIYFRRLCVKSFCGHLHTYYCCDINNYLYPAYARTSPYRCEKITYVRAYEFKNSIWEYNYGRIRTIHHSIG